jgi:hypothetical protein
MSEGVSGPLRVAGVPAYVPSGDRLGEDWACLLYCGPYCGGLGLDWLSRGEFARNAVVRYAVVALAASYQSLGVSRPFAAAAS